MRKWSEGTPSKGAYESQEEHLHALIVSQVIDKYLFFFIQHDAVAVARVGPSRGGRA